MKKESKDFRDIKDLTLLLVHLTSWVDETKPGYPLFRAWRGYLFEILNDLESDGSLLLFDKSLVVTDDGVKRAESLKSQWFRGKLKKPARPVKVRR
jgi:hypothetical protein